MTRGSNPVGGVAATEPRQQVSRAEGGSGGIQRRERGPHAGMVRNDATNKRTEPARKPEPAPPPALEVGSPLTEAIQG